MEPISGPKEEEKRGSEGEAERKRQEEDERREREKEREREWEKERKRREEEQKQDQRKLERQKAEEKEEEEEGEERGRRGKKEQTLDTQIKSMSLDSPLPNSTVSEIKVCVEFITVTHILIVLFFCPPTCICTWPFYQKEMLA